MFFRIFGWVVATRGRKGDKGEKGRAYVSRLGTKGGQRRARLGAREGKERRPSMAATRTRGTREREARPSMAATRTRGEGGRRAEREERDRTKGGHRWPRLKTRGKGGRRATKDGQGRPRLKTWHRHISSLGSNEDGLGMSWQTDVVRVRENN